MEFVGVCRFCRFSDIRSFSCSHSRVSTGAIRVLFQLPQNSVNVGAFSLQNYKLHSLHSPKTEKRSNISAAAMWYISAPTAISIAISLTISISLIFSAAILTEEQGHSSSSNVDLGLTEARHRNPPDPVVQYTRVETKSNQYTRKQPIKSHRPTHSLEYNPNSYKKFTLV